VYTVRKNNQLSNQSGGIDGKDLFKLCEAETMYIANFGCWW
jgi:hypothetical protein